MKTNTQRGGKIPKAVHEASFDLGGFKIDVAVLDNGQRLITQEGMENFLKWLGSGVIIDEEVLKKFALFIKSK